MNEISKRKVYLSSTFKDLEPYRDLVIRKFESQLSGSFELCTIMEYMIDTGKSIPPIEECIIEVKESDVYLLILGNRVGSKPKNSNKTYTEIEYETAMSMKDEKCIFRFVNTNFNKEECDDVDEYMKIKNELSDLRPHSFDGLTSFQLEFINCMLNIFAEKPLDTPIKNDRKYYMIMAGIIAIIMIFLTSIVYKYTNDVTMAALVPLIFSCIILYILKNIIFPSNLRTYRK